MSNWCGPAGKGAMRQLRQFKREEAEERDSRTPPERRSRKREAARRGGPGRCERGSRMSTKVDSCTADPAADWREQGWCCRECAITAHLAWCQEHGLRCGGNPPRATEVVPA